MFRVCFFFFSSRRRHTRWPRDWSSDVCSSDLKANYQEEMIPDDQPETHNDVEDELFDEAVQLIVSMQSASVSMLQRRFRIGYTRAARLIDAMEDRQIVGPYEGNKPRTVYIEKPEDETS